MNRRAIIIFLFCFVGLVLLFAYQNEQGAIDEATLIERCEKSYPKWNDYQEHIKAIDAGAVAQWDGTLVSAKLNEDLELVFSLEGYWAETVAAMPVLVRLPDGREHKMFSFREEATSEIRYYFRPEKAFTAAFPWVDVHYPHTEQRLSFDSQGEWRKKL